MPVYACGFGPDSPRSARRAPTIHPTRDARVSRRSPRNGASACAGDCVDEQCSTANTEGFKPTMLTAVGVRLATSFRDAEGASGGSGALASATGGQTHCPRDLAACRFFPLRASKAVSTTQCMSGIDDCPRAVVPPNEEAPLGGEEFYGVAVVKSIILKHYKILSNTALSVC